MDLLLLRQIRTVPQHDGFNSRAEPFGVERLIEVVKEHLTCRDVVGVHFVSLPRVKVVQHAYDRHLELYLEVARVSLDKNSSDGPVALIG